VIGFTLPCETVSLSPRPARILLRKPGQDSKIADGSAVSNGHNHQDNSVLNRDLFIRQMRKLRVYVDRDLIRPDLGVHWMVRPLLDTSLATKCSLQTDPLELRPFDRILAEYNRTASEIFELSDLQDCDVAIVPLNWDEVRGGFSWAAKPDRELVSAVQKSCLPVTRAGKPLVIFFSESRSHEPVPVPGAVVFRHALYRSRRTPLDHAMPVMIIADPMQDQYADLFAQYRHWGAKPTIGFCGFSRDVKISETLKTGIYKAYTFLKFGHPDVSQFKGLRLRSKALQVLGQSPIVDANFIIRDESVFLTNSKEHFKRREVYRAEFFRNIADSDYQICLRGSANHSRRPWETLSCARIPLFIDTDCVLPFESQVDWADYMPIVEEADIGRLPEHVHEFHCRIPPDLYGDRQRGCRNLWEKWLSPHGFARQFHANFESLVVTPSRRS